MSFMSTWFGGSCVQSKLCEGGGKGISVSDDDVDLERISFSRHDNSNNSIDDTIIPKTFSTCIKDFFATIDSYRFL